jgi:hypothetical protein
MGSIFFNSFSVGGIAIIAPSALSIMDLAPLTIV